MQASKETMKPIKTNLGGFPCFYYEKRKPRLITNDVWSLLEHLVHKSLAKEESNSAMAFLEQAEDYYESAKGARTSTKPLLYFYSFLNLSKVLFLMKRIGFPNQMRHGIAEHGINIRKRFKFEGQRVEVYFRKQQAFSLLAKYFGYKKVVDSSHFKIIDLLEYLAPINRTYVNAASKPTLLCPVEAVEIVKTEGMKLHVRLRIQDRYSLLVSELLKNPFFKNKWTVEKETAKQSLTLVSVFLRKYKSGRGIDRAISGLAVEMRKMGMLATLTKDGYRYYLYLKHNADTLPQLCSIYAVMFYLGSVTRYKPHDFDKIDKKHAWLLNEFLSVEPKQFLYLLASYIAETDVVVPMAISE